MFFFLRFFTVLCLALALLFVFFYIPIAGKTSWSRLHPDPAPVAGPPPKPGAPDLPLDNLSASDQAGLDNLLKAKLKEKRLR